MDFRPTTLRVEKHDNMTASEWNAMVEEQLSPRFYPASPYDVCLRWSLSLSRYVERAQGATFPQESVASARDVQERD